MRRRDSGNRRALLSRHRLDGGRLPNGAGRQGTPLLSQALPGADCDKGELAAARHGAFAAQCGAHHVARRGQASPVPGTGRAALYPLWPLRPPVLTASTLIREGGELFPFHRLQARADAPAARRPPAARFFRLSRGFFQCPGQAAAQKADPDCGGSCRHPLQPRCTRSPKSRGKGWLSL